jgi:hypothetical protein
MPTTGTRLVHDCSTGESRYEEYEIPDLTPEELAEQEDAIIAQKQTQLWNDADQYQMKFISGAALSLLTLGVLQQKPISLSIMAWIQTIWNGNYYPQKAALTVDSPVFDFSVCGPMPYSVPELSAEVLG